MNWKDRLSYILKTKQCHIFKQNKISSSLIKNVNILSNDTNYNSVVKDRHIDFHNDHSNTETDQNNFNDPFLSTYY